ncbi:MAG: penicillin acylase family protein [Rhodospirillales bacterium]
MNANPSHPGTPRRRPNFLRGLFDAVRPRTVSLKERLASFPTEGLPVERTLVIRWNSHQVPFIEAETEHDAALALGLVHAHLRGAQIALFKRFFYGRLAELVGRFGRDFDHVIRILDYGRGADALGARLPDATRAWIEAYVEGLNAYQDRLTTLPPEFAVLGIQPERYEFRDILVGSRFAATDFTWLTYFPLLAERGRPGFAELWNRTLAAGELPTVSGHPRNQQGEFEDLMLGAGRIGSNSVVVGPEHSASGGALIASDPHLGLSLPNLWVLLGLRSPSFNVVGLTIVGLPVFGLGRNPDLAWGGTNLRAASSDLYDLSRLPPEQIETKETVIRTRFGRDSRRPLRSSPFGPIVSDAKIVKMANPAPIALRWIGYEATDEFTGLLDAARARTPDEFRSAFKDYGISGQNMLFADVNGNIGYVMAVTQPIRSSFPKDDPVLDAADPATHWTRFATALDLPFVLNPPRGVIASANDQPKDTDIPIGFTFGTDDRVYRLYDLLEAKPKLEIEDLKKLQTDTLAVDAKRLISLLVAEIDRVPGLGNDVFIRRIKGWDGDYAVDSAGAVAFETFLYHLVLGIYGARDASELPELYSQWSYLTTFLVPDLRQRDDAARRTLLATALARGAKDAARFPTWGDMHRLQVGTSLTRIPFLGRAFVIKDLPVGGSRQTPMKMSHGMVNGRHTASFGSMARHISDLSDLDANWFTLLGGQDGWIGSVNFLDQLDLWQERRFIRMPLRPETVKAEFPITMTLKP